MFLRGKSERERERKKRLKISPSQESGKLLFDNSDDAMEKKVSKKGLKINRN